MRGVSEAVNNDYEAYCMADPLFYDSPGVGSESELYNLAQLPEPDGWNRTIDDHWVIYTPEVHDAPSQGWKVHVSSILDNADHIIDVVWSYCGSRNLPFKFLRGPRIALSRNSKYAGRGGSGKLITIYPSDESDLERVCVDLSDALAGQQGPYILSDLRWGEGPLHVRYGGFAPRYCRDERGEQVLAIEDPLGTLVPDKRSPVFTVPPWVDLPAFLQPHLEARNAVTMAEIPYSIDEALHFSNGGGVYVGTDRRTGEKVVLKEARPHAGLSGDGADAVTRLGRERDVLERLAGIGAVPRFVDFFAVGEHQFLVMEHVEGEPLNKELVRRCPLITQAVSHEELASYAHWVSTVYEGVEAAIAAIHGRGVAYGDLHMFNIIVRPDGQVALVDFEVADSFDGGRHPGLGAVGFAAPRDRLGADRDLYALACLRLALFLPLEPLISLDRSKSVELADVVAEIFPLSRESLDPAVQVITGEASPAAPDRLHLEPGESGWSAVRDSISRAIVASATPERDDRLVPGDIVQFTAGGLNIAYGAAGVLYALDVTGAGRHPEYEDWLVRLACHPRDGTRLGFYDGLHGVAYVLAHLGHHEEALKVLDICLGEHWEASGHDLFGGLAGMGLNFAHLAAVTGEAALDEAAERATALVAAGLGTVEGTAEISGGKHAKAGLLRGSAGRALLFVRMYERTGEPELLGYAAMALRQDLRRCVRRAEDGQLHVNEGWRTLPYLNAGSTGIGLVLQRYLAHRDDDEFAEAVEAIGGAARSLFYSQAGLFNGRAGMVLYLGDGRRLGEPPDAELAAQVRRLDWHALGFRGGLAFPGDQLLRLSMDLATGSAGVLLALGAALHDEPVHLPFLGPAVPAPGAGELI